MLSWGLDGWRLTVVCWGHIIGHVMSGGRVPPRAGRDRCCRAGLLRRRRMKEMDEAGHSVFLLFWYGGIGEGARST
jgi:hypothetical protein